jgi:putative transcriptional regulator
MSAELTNRIRVFRAEHRMSQAELAEAIGVSRKTISTIEVGRFVPSTVIALRIARHFGVPVEEIFSLDEPDRARAAARNVRA